MRAILSGNCMQTKSREGLPSPRLALISASYWNQLPK